MSIQDEAELVMVLRDYCCKKRGTWDEGIDITALDESAREKILLRVITTKSKSGFYGVDAVQSMVDAMKRGRYDKGFLIAKRFTNAAKEEMAKNNIQRISESHMLPFKPERLYLQLNTYVEKLCKAKCGKVPEAESDCQSDCKVRVISDNATFHFENGWLQLLKNDFKQLLMLQKTGNL
jgi:hypothetical protein